ncbi:MAG: ribosome biogenesis GTPase Der [Planctomycetes bacterium]|nr:ribosome biogenesis GTPase Der [Planctomycetota bacterium]
MERLPIVAIVGRQNVGKSSLLNALAGRRLSIVDATPGVTRDRVSAIVSFKGAALELVDTAGIGLSRADRFHAPVERQIQYAIESADLALLVVDVQEGLTALDRQAADRLRRAGKAVVIVANKADHAGLDTRAIEFGELGMGEPAAVSASHRRRVGELMDQNVARLPREADSQERPLLVENVGNLNGGKTTFINALAGEERVIVSEEPGTTRDAVDVHLRREGKSVILVDTAGVRKKQRVADSVEFFSRARAEEAIGRADVVVLMIDVQERITEIDKRIGGMIEERKKPALIVLNKWDLVPEGMGTGDFRKYIDRAMPVLSYVPILFISAKEGARVWDVLTVAEELHQQAGVKIPTADVNRVVQRAQAERSPGTRSGAKLPKIYYAAQSRAHPPTFQVFVNDPRSFAPDYVRFLERKLREYLPFREVPIRLALRARRGRSL